MSGEFVVRFLDCELDPSLPQHQVHELNAGADAPLLAQRVCYQAWKHLVSVLIISSGQRAPNK